MPAFKVDDLVKVTQTGSAPKPGFITSTDGTSYTIEYFDNTTEEGVADKRLKKGLETIASGRPGVLTDRRMVQTNTGKQYKYSVIYTDPDNGRNGRHVRADMQFKDAFPFASSLKGGRTRRSKKSKSKSRRRR